MALGSIYDKVDIRSRFGSGSSRWGACFEIEPLRGGHHVWFLEREREKKNIRRQSNNIYTTQIVFIWADCVCVCDGVFSGYKRSEKPGLYNPMERPITLRDVYWIHNTNPKYTNRPRFSFFLSLSPLLSCVYYLERDGLSPWVYGWLCVFVFLHRCHNTQPAPPPTAAAADKSRVCVYTQAKAKTGKLHMEAFTLSPHTFLFRSLACDGYMALSLFDPTLIFFILFCTRGIHPAIRKNLGRRHSRSLVLKKNA